MLAREQNEILDKIGVMKESDYIINEKQADYFCSKFARDLINKKDEEGKEFVTYEDVADIKLNVLNVLNKAFDAPCIGR